MLFYSSEFPTDVRVSMVSTLALCIVCAGQGQAQQSGPTDLGTILLEADALEGEQAQSNSDAEGNAQASGKNGDAEDDAPSAASALRGTGGTALGKDALDARRGGAADANAAFLSLPTVQYRQDIVNGEINDDIGTNGDNEINLQPEEFSINGASVIENTILLDGVPVNSNIGNQDPTGTGSLERESGRTPRIYRHYGLHAQSQYIPADLVEEAEVIDSNVSAEYGGFQGGVVKYELIKPKREHSGRFSYSYQDDKFVDYSIGTEDGLNPDNVSKPEFRKQTLSFSQTGPIGDSWSYIVGYSRQTGWTRKDIEPQYGDYQVESKSHSDFYRLGFGYEFDNNSTLSVTGNVTDYEQEWDADSSLLGIDVANRAFLLDATYDKDIGSANLFGFAASNLKFSLKATYDNSESANLHSDNVWYSWYGRYRDYETDAFDAWCDEDRVNPSETLVSCDRGGAGDRYYKDKGYGLSLRFSGDILGGGFKSGFDIKKSVANRQGEGFTFYSSTRRLTDGSTYNCAPGDPACVPTQAHWIRIKQDPFDVEVDALKTSAFLEFGREFKNFDYSLGLRADYNDVLKNTDIAPRLSATWKPHARFGVNLGANRYYSDNYLAYAIHDAVPRGINQRRDVPRNGGGDLGEWYDAIDLGQYSYSQGNLKTPYTDELTLTFNYRDPWSGGNWRLRGTYREGRDQFARSQDSSSTDNTLTNEGRNEFVGVVAEYQSQWRPTRPGVLDFVGFNISGAWSKTSVSNNTYFGNDGDSGVDEFIWYNGQSYTLNDFAVVTGNMDIPVKFSAEITTSFQQGRYKLGMGADLTLGYTAAVDTGQTGDFDNPAYGRQRHDIYEDKRLDAVATLNLAASARIAKVRGNPLYIDLKVSNLLDERGNGTASNSNPWVSGRRVWIGSTLTW